MDIAEAITDYLADSTHLADGTQADYQRKLETFAAWAFLQGLTLETVNNRSVSAFLDMLRATHTPLRRGKTQLSSVTLADYVRVLCVFLRWCVSDEEYGQFVTSRTVSAIKFPRVEQFVKPVFTDEEIAALFEACKHEDKQYAFRLRDAAILSVLLDTGIRAAEIRTLTIGNVTLARHVQDDSYITVMGKGRKQREVPIGTIARRSLARYLRYARKDAAKGDIVFLSRYGSQMSHEALKDIIERLRALSSLPKDTSVNPHKFRHTFATRYMAQGGELYDLSRLLGHSSVAMTEKYIKTLSAHAVRTRKPQHSVLDSM